MSNTEADCYLTLKNAARALVNAAEAWDNDLSSWCDGKERDAVRMAVIRVKRTLEDRSLVYGDTWRASAAAEHIANVRTGQSMQHGM